MVGSAIRHRMDTGDRNLAAIGSQSAVTEVHPGFSVQYHSFS
ncbi:MAG: hypothetical protein AAF827_21985 [Cyanobacteria bacterium P01_D01_bin.6]